MKNEQKLEDIKEIIVKKIEQFGLSEDIFSEWDEDIDSFNWEANYNIDWDDSEEKIRRLIFESIKQAKEALRRKDLYAALWFIYCITTRTQELSDFYDSISNDVLRLLDDNVVGEQWPELPEGYKAEIYDTSDNQKSDLYNFLLKTGKDQMLEYTKELIYERLAKFELSRDILIKWDSDYSINWDDEERKLKVIAFESIDQLKEAVKRGDIYAELWFIDLVYINMGNLGKFYLNISEDVYKLLDEDIVGNQWLDLPEGYEISSSTYDIPDNLKIALGVLLPISSNSNSSQESLNKESKKEYVTKIELKKLESFLIEEIKGNKKGTFAYKLNEEDFFDKGKLDNLLNKSYEYLEVSDKNSENYIYIIKGLLDQFFYTAFSLFWSNEPRDLYKIKNYPGFGNDDKVLPEEVSREDISDMQDRMREIIGKIK